MSGGNLVEPYQYFMTRCLLGAAGTWARLTLVSRTPHPGRWSASLETRGPCTRASLTPAEPLRRSHPLPARVCGDPVGRQPGLQGVPSQEQSWAGLLWSFPRRGSNWSALVKGDFDGWGGEGSCLRNRCPAASPPSSS